MPSSAPSSDNVRGHVGLENVIRLLTFTFTQNKITPRHRDKHNPLRSTNKIDESTRNGAATATATATATTSTSNTPKANGEEPEKNIGSTDKNRENLNYNTPKQRTKRLSSSKCAFMYKMMLNPKSYITLSILSIPVIISRQQIPHFIDYISPQFVRPFLGKIVLSSSSKRCNSHLRHKLFIFL